MSDAIDCVVIGSGPGGYVAAIRAAQLGLRTVVVERSAAVGGRCLHEACIPAKTILRSADVLEEVRGAAELGIVTTEAGVDFGAVARRRDKVIEGLAGGVAGLLRKNGVQVVRGEATCGADGTVSVGTQVLRPTRATILAAGSVPRPLPRIPFGGRVISTKETWALDEVPATIAVAGAGASGAEIASAYARLGTRVLLFDVADRVLPTEDVDISRVVARGFVAQGVELHLATGIEEVLEHDSHLEVTFPGGTVDVDWLVVAAGRGPDLDGLGLAERGVELTAAGLIAVDGRQETSVAGTYAIGDLVEGPALAHKASDEGIIAAEAAAGRDVHPLRHADIPRATFCHPNVGSVGLTEQQARDQGIDVVVGRVPYGAVGASATYGAVTGLVKIVGDRSVGEIVGGHVVGTRATDLVQQLCDVRALEGGYPELARIIHGHPTFSELIVEAARAADGWLVHG